MRYCPVVRELGGPTAPAWCPSWLLWIPTRTLKKKIGCSGFSLWTPEHVGFVGAARGSSCPAACGILVPRSGIDFTSLILEGGFFTTGPPGKSPSTLFLPSTKCPVTSLNPLLLFSLCYRRGDWNLYKVNNLTKVMGVWQELYPTDIGYQNRSVHWLIKRTLTSACLVC